MPYFTTSAIGTGVATLPTAFITQAELHSGSATRLLLPSPKYFNPAVNPCLPLGKMYSCFNVVPLLTDENKAVCGGLFLQSVIMVHLRDGYMQF
jgi:hypothetical protein